MRTPLPPFGHTITFAYKIQFIVYTLSASIRIMPPPLSSFIPKMVWIFWPRNQLQEASLRFYGRRPQSSNFSVFMAFLSRKRSTVFSDPKLHFSLLFSKFIFIRRWMCLNACALGAVLSSLCVSGNCGRMSFKWKCQASQLVRAQNFGLL